MESLGLSATALSLLQAAVQGGAVGHSHAPARPAEPGHRQNLGTGRAWTWAEPGHEQNLNMGRAWAQAESGHGQSLDMGRAWAWAEPGHGQSPASTGPPLEVKSSQGCLISISRDSICTAAVLQSPRTAAQSCPCRDGEQEQGTRSSPNAGRHLR